MYGFEISKVIYIIISMYKSICFATCGYSYILLNLLACSLKYLNMLSVLCIVKFIDF
jgi:hypothetical protein